MRFSVNLSVIAILFGVISLATANRVIEWKRRLDTCDPADRAFMQGDTTRLIYAYNDDQNVVIDGDVQYHGPQRRGSKSVKMFSPPIDQQIAAWNQTKPADTYTWDMLVHNHNQPLPFDSNVTGPTTSYWCNAFALPNMNDSQWIIRFESITPTNLAPFMHHLLVYECPAIEQNLEWLNFEGHCYDQTGYNPIPQGLLNCNGASIVAAWAVGGETYLFPSYLGLPFGGSNGGTRYILVESHWNNPSHKPIVIDTSGMRFYATRQKPTYEAGVLEVGHATSGAFTIPAQSPDYTYEAWCPAECTQFMFNSSNTGTLISPNGGIRLVSNFLHAHTTGIKIQLHRVNKQGVEDIIVEDNSYDFNFQTTTNLATPIDVYPGETLRVNCHYNTMSRTAPTPFGLSTQQEMCIAFSMYYPRLLNTKSACNFANYTLIGRPDIGSFASCGNNLNPQEEITVLGDANILPIITQPYQPPNCSYNPPPSSANHGPKGILSPYPFDSNNFPIHVPLDPNNQIFLHYAIDNLTNIIHMAIEYPTTQGWMGLGYGGNGGMAGSDINLGWIDNLSGNVFLTDRLATVEAKPAIDQYNDLYDIIAYNSTKQVVPPSTPPPSSDSSASSDGTILAAVLGSVGGVLILLIIYRNYKQRMYPFQKHDSLKQSIYKNHQADSASFAANDDTHLELTSDE